MWDEWEELSIVVGGTGEVVVGTERLESSIDLEIFSFALRLKLEDLFRKLRDRLSANGYDQSFQRMNLFHDFDISRKTRKAGTWG